MITIILQMNSTNLSKYKTKQSYNPMEQFKNRNKNSDNEFIFDSNEKSTTNLGYF